MKDWDLIELRHFVRMSVMREKEALNEHLNDISGIVVDAHILETFQNATSGYIVSKDLNYVIDPVTYRFDINPISDCTSKRWYDRLVKNYNMEDLIQPDGRIKRGKLSDSSRARDFVKSVVKYEETRVQDLSGETMAFFSLLAEKTTAKQKPPYCVIPPYFLIDSSKILELNVSLIKEARGLTNNRLFGYIPLNYDLLYNQSARDTIVKQYSDLKVDGYFVWVTDFDEVKERSESLGLFDSFVDSLKSKVGKREVINMFGGFFSTMLATLGRIDGLVHGIGISESRDPYTPGGPAPTRYYVPILHRMLTPENAQDLFSKLPRYWCNCQICSGTSPSDMSVMQLVRHALNAKVAERTAIESLSAQDIIRMLERDHERVVSSATDPISKRQHIALAVHLREWVRALREYAA
jgi:hypothetical protein